LLQDIIDEADKWGNGGKTGRIDPFTDVFDVSLFCGMSFFEIGAELTVLSWSSS
jgi:hypothetical protein